MGEVKNENIDIPSQEWIVDKGAMWEKYPFKIITNLEIGCDEGEDCKHCHSHQTKVNTRHDGSTWDEKLCICPTVAIVFNEGECNSTGLCVDCLLEAIKENNIPVKSLQ